MIVVTGKKGQLSVAICDYLIKSGLTQTKCLSVRGDDWSENNFQGVDIVVHVAGIVPKPGVQKVDFETINHDLTRRLAQAAKAQGVRQFIYISSMAVYGIQASLHAKKGIVGRKTKCSPQTDYGRSKFEAENELEVLQDEQFKVAIIRVPSIYSDEKRDYFQQYELVCNKFKCVPVAFRRCRRSAISVTNLCELIRLIITSDQSGVFCPDNGNMSAYDYCRMIHPELRQSKVIGLGIEIFLRWHPIVKACFGTVAYSPELTEVFDGRYRKEK